MVTGFKNQAKNATTEISFTMMPVITTAVSICVAMDASILAKNATTPTIMIRTLARASVYSLAVVMGLSGPEEKLVTTETESIPTPVETGAFQLGAVIEPSGPELKNVTTAIWTTMMPV